jgi:hypothetical protein
MEAWKKNKQNPTVKQDEKVLKIVQILPILLLCFIGLEKVLFLSLILPWEQIKIPSLKSRFF